MSTAFDFTVTDAQLAKYSSLIYDVTGIRISPQKKTLLSNRLRRRLRETGLADFDVYYKQLERLPANHPEWDAFLQEITTHETYLFRDEAHWQWLQMQYLPEIGAEARAGKRQRSLRIWSAACSTGDEATTISLCVTNSLLNGGSWQVKILGTDIGVGAVSQARLATFDERAMKLVPPEMKIKYFVHNAAAKSWTAKPVITKHLEFRQHNLLEPLAETPFDIVFLKNVLIYFDPPSKSIVLGNLARVMRPGSLLVAGAAEGISELLKGYERVQPWLYRRQ